MSARRIILLIPALLGASMFAAQPPQDQLVPRAPVPIVMPPIPPSPIEEFRRWLRIPEADREKILASYTEEKRTVLREKLSAYEAMPADQRERRLRMLELRWYLRLLMGAAPGQRGDYLEMIPPRLHDSITSRLQKWDDLAPDTRRDILANEDARELVIRYFAHLRRGSRNAADLHPLSADQRAQLRESLRIWNQSSQAHREKMGEHLATFFDLSKSDQARTLGLLADAERQEMQKTLDAFARLSPAHRQACVDSFKKFASMTPPERAAFLRNAAHWQQMTAQERETWRRLVHKLPPMPPEPIMLPPTPPVSQPSAG